ncbi:MAG TPA: hypothetical protein VK021_01740 [Flavobacteriaceae bacterium]|nr:hypothetical protein [Flavobacteriaceae bacterium]
MKMHLYFKYNNPPSNFIDKEIHLLPNPQQDIQGFLGWFLKDYQSDERVEHLRELYKLKGEKSDSKAEKQSSTTKNQVEEEIMTLEDDLRLEACENFYKLLMENTVEIVSQDEDNQEKN